MQPNDYLSIGSERPINWRRALTLALQELRSAGLLKGSIVILIGSYAHEAATKRSDIDILVVGSEDHPRRRKIKSPEFVHMQYEDIKKFRARAEAGDDFVIAALRFGKVVYDPIHAWDGLRREFAMHRWPDWQEKMKYAARRVRLGDDLVQSGDIDAGAEEYLLAATQIARAVLLRKQIYPLSRPQLPAQLRSAGESQLANVIEDLMSQEPERMSVGSVGSQLHGMLWLT